MINKANSHQLLTKVSSNNLNLSDFGSKHLSPRSFQIKNQTPSTKITPKHSKGFYSRSKSRTRLPKKNSIYTSPIKERLLKTAHPSENFQKYNEQKYVDCFSSKLSIPFKDVLLNYSKENKIKSTKKHKKFPKKLSFDPQNFFSQLKTKSFPIKSSALASTDLNLIKSFTYEYSQVVNKVDLSLLGLLNYSTFCKVLNKLRFISNPICKSEEETHLVLKSWKILGGLVQQKVLTEDLHLFLLAVLGVPFHLVSNSTNPNRKPTLWSLSQKEIQSINEDFYLFLSSRNAPVIIFDKKETTSEEISESDSEKIDVEMGVALREITEKADVQYLSLNDIETAKRPKLVKKISLRELSSSPALHKAATSRSMISGDTPKDLSLNTSESEEGAKGCILLTPSVKSEVKSGLGKICVSKMANKEPDIKPDLNLTVSYKKDSEKKFQYGMADDKLGESMLYESNLLNISEVPFLSTSSLRRSQRLNTVDSEKKKNRFKNGELI